MKCSIKIKLKKIKKLNCFLDNFIENKKLYLDNCTENECDDSLGLTCQNDDGLKKCKY